MDDIFAVNKIYDDVQGKHESNILWREYERDQLYVDLIEKSLGIKILSWQNVWDTAVQEELIIFNKK